MTGSDPAPSPHSLGVPDPGTRRQGGGGGGGNSLILHVGPTYAHWGLESWRKHKTFGCDLNNKFLLIIIEVNPVKKSKLKCNVRDWLKRYRSTLLVMKHCVWCMMQFMFLSMQLYIRWSIAEYYIFVHPYPCQYGVPADLLSICNFCKTFPLLEQEGTGPSLLPSK